jgi:uncharacterized small protein (DUF1192 family)
MGVWLLHLKRNYPDIPPRSAQKAMQLYNNRELIAAYFKSAGSAHLSVDAALKLIANPKGATKLLAPPTEEAETEEAEETRKLSTVAKLNARIADLTSENATLRAKLQRSDESLFDLIRDDGVSIGRVFPGTISESKFDVIVKTAKEGYKALRALLKSKKAPAG